MRVMEFYFPLKMSMKISFYVRHIRSKTLQMLRLNYSEQQNWEELHQKPNVNAIDNDTDILLTEELITHRDSPGRTEIDQRRTRDTEADRGAETDQRHGDWPETQKLTRD